MRKVCFIVSHECSDAPALFDVLQDNPRLAGYRTNRTYNHPLTLDELTALPHKLGNAAAVWFDLLLHNHQFCCKELYSICKFIYVIGEAAPTLEGLVSAGYRPDAALRYYAYRLRRICEMAKRTPGAVLLTSRGAAQGLPLIEKYLNLKHPLAAFAQERPTTRLVKWPLVEEGQKCYERHLYFLKNQRLSSGY